MKTYTIYYHIFPNGKMYFGQTCRKPEIRWGEKGKGYKKQKLIWNAIQKYGWDNIDHRIISIGLDKDEADFLEMFYISAYRTNEPKFGYNLTSGGEGTQGCKYTESTKQKRSEYAKTRVGEKAAMNGKHHTDETKQKIREKRKTYICTDETKKKLRNSNKGAKNPMYGKQHTEETKHRISESLKGRMAWNKGKKTSEETKQKMRKNHYDISGINHPMYGKHLSEETKKKLRKPKTKYKWLLPTGEIMEMTKSRANKYHPDWILINE